MAAILIIDDELGIRQALTAILEDEKYRVFSAEDAMAGMKILEDKKIDIVFLDVLLPKLGGLEALDQIHANWPGLEVVMISGHANIDMAVRAVKGGAFDFLEKPLSLDKVLTVCRNALALRKLREENRKLKKSASLTHSDIVGTSDAMNGIRELVRQAASTDARVLITGENGTGKEVVARAIHSGSSRCERPFVGLNCAAIPDTLLESELFGHEKGAFTDAVSSRKGRFEIAGGGTLFLDEIGDMSLSAQAKVLRVIQEQKIERVGGEKTINTDVRLIAASNKDLEKACAQGLFRQDLYFRLNVIPIHIPPLRERKEDITLLLMYFLNEQGIEKLRLEDDAAEMLLSHDWPGNVRELKNLAERIAVMHTGDSINGQDIAGLLCMGTGGEDAKSATPAIVKSLMEQNFNDAKESFEKCYLEFQFSMNNGIISKTAEAIGIYPSNLHAKLKKHGIASHVPKEEQ
ncbi:MAG: sigma-54 dependent transcriptional regulator [Treponema sp.]|jgi:two-component system nitrogen regulation response regulator NtrX|nr:sigma-54 dependent transcriptional regulator [Treponema sp.]